MPNGDPWDRFFYKTLTLMMDLILYGGVKAECMTSWKVYYDQDFSQGHILF